MSSPSETTIQMAGGHELILRRNQTEDALEVHRPGAVGSIHIALNSDGVHLTVSGTNLSIRSSGTLAIDADRLAIHGRESVDVSSGGSMRLTSCQTMETQGRNQIIRSTHGNVNIKANDDVCLDGERVRLNS